MNTDLKIQYIVARYMGILCHFRLINYSDSWAKIRRNDYCPVCNKKIIKGENFYLTINNSNLFPNCLIHAKCISQTDKVGLKFMNFAGIIEAVYNNYVQCLEARKEYKALYKSWRIEV